MWMGQLSTAWVPESLCGRWKQREGDVQRGSKHVWTPRANREHKVQPQAGASRETRALWRIKGFRHRRRRLWWLTWRASVHYVADDVASTGTPCGGGRREGQCSTWWMTWRVPVHYVVDDVASIVTLCSGRRGEYRYTVWRMMWRAPVRYVADDVASNNALCGG
jgi:hypothetical protein